MPRRLLDPSTGGAWWQAGGSADAVHALPGTWPEIPGETTQVRPIVGSVLLVLPVASEFSWRTARQNVVDGLSRERTSPRPSCS